MNRIEFQEIVDKITGGTYHPPKRKSTRVNFEGHDGYYGPTLELKVKWVTGGEQGGNCWDDNASPCGVDAEIEPEFKQLDEILTAISPGITFLQYKSLMTKVVYDTETEYEYYGNYADYGTKKISIDDVWNFLQEQGLV
jgi:hypothetical protein